MVERRANGSGKWRRAVSVVEDMQAAQESNIEVVEIISPAVNHDVLSTTQNNNIIDLYSVGHEEVTRFMCDSGVEVPFQHTLHLLGPQGAVLYTAPHDLPDSVGIIWSPNVTNCHMVGPVDSAGFRWSKC